MWLLGTQRCTLGRMFQFVEKYSVWQMFGPGGAR
jgi:hypothetical protein